MTLLSLVTIRARSPERSVNFYRQLGLEFEEHQHGSGALHWCALIGSTAFEIYPCSGEASPTAETRESRGMATLVAMASATEKAGRRRIVIIALCLGHRTFKQRLGPPEPHQITIPPRDHPVNPPASPHHNRAF